MTTVGLGAMGTPLTWTVEQSAFGLAVYNRTTERPVEFAEAGVKVADAPRHLTDLADVGIVMVSDGEAVEEVLERRLGLLAGVDGDTTVVLMSRIPHAETLAAAESIRARDFEPHFTVEKQQKNHPLAVEANGEAVLPLPRPLQPASHLPQHSPAVTVTMT